MYPVLFQSSFIFDMDSSGTVDDQLPSPKTRDELFDNINQSEPHELSNRHRRNTNTSTMTTTKTGNHHRNNNDNDDDNGTQRCCSMCRFVSAMDWYDFIPFAVIFVVFFAVFLCVVGPTNPEPIPIRVAQQQQQLVPEKLPETPAPVQLPPKMVPVTTKTPSIQHLHQ